MRQCGDETALDDLTDLTNIEIVTQEIGNLGNSDQYTPQVVCIELDQFNVKENNLKCLISHDGVGGFKSLPWLFKYAIKNHRYS